MILLVSGWALNGITSVRLGKIQRKSRHRRRESDMKITAEMRLQAQECWHQPGAGRGRERTLSQSHRRENGAAGIWASPQGNWPQNCKPIYLSCFKPLNLWEFVTVAMRSYDVFHVSFRYILANRRSENICNLL